MEEAEALRRGGGSGGGGSRSKRAAGSRGGREAEKLWRALACIFMFVSVAIGVTFAIYASSLPAKHVFPEQASSSLPPPTCGASGGGSGPTLTPAAKLTRNRSNGVYGGLSENDYIAITDFLLGRSELNLTSSLKATLNSNYIFMVEDHLPPKSDALAYVEGRSSASPERRAKVVIFHGATHPKTVREYLVSPLPNPSNVVALDAPIPWRARPVDEMVEQPAIDSFLQRELRSAKELLRSSFGQWIGDDCGVACLFSAAIPRVSPDSDDRLLYVPVYLNSASVEGYYLYHMPLQIVLRATDVSDRFDLKYIYYDHQRYDSVAALLDAISSGALQPLKPFATDRLRGRYASPRRRGPNVNPGGVKPPVQHLPQGPRFTLDGRHVDYLSWSFDVYFRTTSGLALHNVKYGQQSIAYEISMQDVVVLYGGVEPYNFFQSFYDSGFSLGGRNLPLMRGADCPSDAVYLDNYILTHAHAKPRRLKDAVCIFEQRNSVPLRRHYSENFFDGTYNFAFSLPDNVLIVRQILTIWNYDYIFDYEFHQNGVIETKVSSSGYIIVTNSRDRRYGYPIEETVRALANVHSHMFNFRYDLDVAGRKNRLTSIRIELESTSNPVMAGQFKQAVVAEKRARTERESLVPFDFSQPQYYTVQSDGERNAAGQPKGYRIQSNHFAHALLPDDNPQMRAASWTRTKMAVTRYKDDERSTASLYTQADPKRPVVDFKEFYADDESIDGEDIVAWATVGMHHIPSLEDVPVTTTPGRTLSVALVPFNFFDEDPSIGSSDAFVALKSDKGEPTAVFAHLNKTEPCLLVEGDVSLRV